jgi:hypothetical protein
LGELVGLIDLRGPGKMIFIGIDLAWGERKRDGVCAIQASRRKAEVLRYDYPRGDDELLFFSTS